MKIEHFINTLAGFDFRSGCPPELFEAILRNSFEKNKLFRRFSSFASEQSRFDSLFGLFFRSYSSE